MIPKIIHYCWFGNGSKSKLVVDCIKSWKKYFPEYEIIEWNENNYDVNKIRYIKEAYEMKKYAFVSDYVRFDVLYKYGGIYFDTDVEVIKRFDDVINRGAFMGREPVRIGGMIASGLGMACEKDNYLFYEVIKSYNDDVFVYSDGKLNTKTVVQRVTELFEKNGFVLTDNSIQTIKGINIYPDDYFCPLGWDGKINITNNTCSIHKYMASWLSEYERKVIAINMKIGCSKGIQRIIYRLYRKGLNIFKSLVKGK